MLGVVGGLLFVGYGLEALGERTGVPDVLLLIALGVAAHASGLLDVRHVGLAGPVLANLALVVILFEGALHMDARKLLGTLPRALLLTLLNLVGAGGVAATAGLLLGFSVPTTIVFGAAVSATSATVLLPLIGRLHLSRPVVSLASSEAMLGDVLSIVTVLTTVAVVRAGVFSIGTLLRQVGLRFGASLAAGAVAGALWALVLRRLRRVRPALLPTVAALLVLYPIFEWLQLGGALATFAFGLMLGNAPGLLGRRGGGVALALTDGETLFFAEVSFLLKTFFFTYLGATIPLRHPADFATGAGLGLVAMAARRPITLLATRGMAAVDRRQLAALGPRGLIAAVLAQIPVDAGWVQGAVIEPLISGAIVSTVAISSLLLWRERLLAQPAVVASPTAW